MAWITSCKKATTGYKSEWIKLKTSSNVFLLSTPPWETQGCVKCGNGERGRSPCALMPPQQDGTSTHSHRWGIPTPTELLALSTVRNSSDNTDIYLWCKGPQGVWEWGRSSKPVPAGSVEGAQGWVVQVSKEPQSLGQNPWSCIPQEQHPTGRRAGCPAALPWALLAAAEVLPWTGCLCTLPSRGLLWAPGLHLCHPNSPAQHTWGSKENKLSVLWQLSYLGHVLAVSCKSVLGIAQL